MGSQGVLTLKALFFEMPEAGGLEVKLQVNKPADLVVKQVRLRINGDGFWNAVSDIVGKGVVSTVKLTVHPVVMGQDMLDSSQFKKGETSCGVNIHLGSIGKFKAKKKTLFKKMTAISQKNDPEFILELEYGEKGFKWKTEGLLIALPVTCGKILKAAQGAYNYLDPPVESPQPVHAHTQPEPEQVSASDEPVTPLKESRPTPLKKSENNKRKSFAALRDELSPMKDSILNFMAPVSDLPNIIKNTILTPTKEAAPEAGEFTFFCTICKSHVAIENMDTHSSVCSTFDDITKETMNFVHDMALTCVICKQQISIDMLDTHSISCYASQNMIVDRSNVKGKDKVTEPVVELSDEEIISKQVEEEEEDDIPSYRRETTFHYDKFYGTDSDYDSQDSYRDLYESRDDFSKLNKEKEETVEKEEEILGNHYSDREDEPEPEKDYDSEEDRERAFSMLYQANFANKKDEQNVEKSDKDKKGIIKKLKDKTNKDNVKEKKTKTDKKDSTTKPSKRKKVKNLAKQLVHL